MTAMPEPVTVWMVHLRRGVAPAEVEGTLSLEADALVFSHGTGEVTRIRLADAQTAKRLRGSPVLMLRWRRDAERRETAFYFRQPPPLEPPDPTTTSLRSAGVAPSPMAAMRRPSKRRQKRSNAQYLAMSGGMLKPTLKTWASEVSAGIAAAGSGR